MLKALVLSLATSYVAWFIQMHEHRVVYPFDATRTAPADAGEPRLAETAFETADGERLVLWQAPPPEGAPVVLFFPGNAGTLADRVPTLTRLLDMGLGVTAVAYRGSSGSSGRPDEAQLIADARAIAEAVAANGAPALILYGESFGSALAVQLAAAGVGDGVILQSPFTSIRDLVAVQYPQEDLTGLFTQRWDSRAAIAAVTQPLLVLHGTEDRLVPIAQGRDLVARAGSADKALVGLEGADHALTLDGAAGAALAAFVTQWMR